MDEFEKWIGNPFLLNKTQNPEVWGATKEQVMQWRQNPWEHPYTRGAWDAWKHLRGEKQ